MRFGLALVALVLAAPAGAHDFFIAPSSHRIAKGDAVSIVMHVGSEKEMDTLPRSNRRVVRFEAQQNGELVSVAGKHGESPAGHVAFEKAGVATIVYQSTHTDIELDGPKFTHYLEEEGLEDIIAERARLGVSESPGRESYARYAKALVTVGDGDRGWDARIGLPAELVALTDPRAGGTGHWQLFYEGKPRANARVDILKIEKDKLTSVAHARTDADGKVALAIPGDGVWLVATTLMRLAPTELQLEGDWESFWVSMTFETGGKLKASSGCAATDPAPGAIAFVLVAWFLSTRRRDRHERRSNAERS